VKLAAVSDALEITFGNSSVEDFEHLNNGYSGAQVYKVTVNGGFYLLKITIDVNEFDDPVRQFTCMQVAAQHGIAPKVYYTDAKNALFISEYISSKPLDQVFAAVREPAALASLVKSIHMLPPFPTLVNFIDGVDQLISGFKSLHMFKEEELAEAFGLYQLIREVYSVQDKDQVSSHNDLNPNNFLFDGEKIWIIDWEASFLNDRYVDLAISSQIYANEPKKISSFLETYFGYQPDEYKLARFFLMQQVCLMYYAVLMCKAGFRQGPSDFRYSFNSKEPTLGEFKTRLKDGQISLNDFHTKVEYGKVMFNTVCQNMRTKQFSEAINVLRVRDNSNDNHRTP
jgi:thiamine kinase-like enzyme